MYKYLVVGKGLFGSAAARYLSAVSDGVALVGPDEPDNWASHLGVFASHYDEARIVSTSAPDEIWAQLDQASISEYATIEAKSGIRFFTPSGRISAVAQGDDTAYPYLPNNAINSRAFTAATCPSDIGYQFPTGYDIVVEGAPSGYLNPRAMVRAQGHIARKQGATIITELVTNVRNQKTRVEISLQGGQVLHTKKVLLTTGSFTNCFDLVPDKVAIKPESVSTVLAEVGPDDAERLAHLPPLNFKSAGTPVIHLSILPPLPYPDGRSYVKVVVNSEADQIQPDFAALSGWFRSRGDCIYFAQAQETLQRLLPTVTFLSWQTKPCAVSYTPSGKPIIDCLDAAPSGSNRIYAAVGGNVGAAHPSDAIGKLAADLMLHDCWTSTIDPTPFRRQFITDWAEWVKTPTAQL